jgi:uncharacterized membrane protein
MRYKIIYISLLFLTFVWCFTIFLAPYLKSINYASNIFIYFFFSKICHQLPERSFYFCGEKLAVCQRCTAIYFSFLAGILFYPLIKKINENYLRYFFYVSIIIIVIDFLFGYINILQNKITIIVSGSLFGIGSSYLIVNVLLVANKNKMES